MPGFVQPSGFHFPDIVGLRCAFPVARIDRPRPGRFLGHFLDLRQIPPDLVRSRLKGIHFRVEPDEFGVGMDVIG
ncbi:MAG: hypothetical protein E5X96_12750 [Mesorhizobium sp.]|nr:MAG: hypothetical protein E5X96_12750 [Mesorhizobium sp.]